MLNFLPHSLNIFEKLAFLVKALVVVLFYEVPLVIHSEYEGDILNLALALNGSFVLHRETQAVEVPN
jgi:hypothetical protein